MRLIFTVLLTAPAALASSTAVFTLDVQQTEIIDRPDRSIQAHFDTWAKLCKPSTGDEDAKLDCPSVPRDWIYLTQPASIALFRDLDGDLYVAGCPIFEQDPREKEDGPSFTPELHGNCLDIEAGQVFSAEISQKRMKIIIRGKQLPLRVYHHPGNRETLNRSLDTYRVGPKTARVYEPNPAPTPHWEPPNTPPPAVQPTSFRRSLRDPGPAATSVKAGVATIRCSTGPSDIYVDGAFMGRAPVTAPLPAVRHEVRAVRTRGAPVTKEFRLKAGESLRVDACR